MKDTHYAKLIRAIRSCETEEQLYVAKGWVQRLGKTITDGQYWEAIWVIHQGLMFGSWRNDEKSKKKI
jgi:hypothetical protein